MSPKTVARFKIGARIDGKDGATVEIDRSSLLFSVRPLGRRQTYVMPLSAVAEMVAWRSAKAMADAVPCRQRAGRVSRGIRFNA